MKLVAILITLASSVVALGCADQKSSCVATCQYKGNACAQNCYNTCSEAGTCGTPDVPSVSYDNCLSLCTKKSEACQVGCNKCKLSADDKRKCQAMSAAKQVSIIISQGASVPNYHIPTGPADAGPDWNQLAVAIANTYVAYYNDNWADYCGTSSASAQKRQEFSFFKRATFDCASMPAAYHIKGENATVKAAVNEANREAKQFITNCNKGF